MGKEQMRKDMKFHYEKIKGIRLECREADIEDLKQYGSEALLRMSIELAERNLWELEGMLDIMRGVGTISSVEYENEKAELEELFSTERLYGVKVDFYTGNLVLCVSEIKKED